MKTLVQCLVSIGISYALIEVFWKIYDKYEDKLNQEYIKGYADALKEHAWERNWGEAYLEGKLKTIKKESMEEEA